MTPWFARFIQQVGNQEARKACSEWLELRAITKRLRKQARRVGIDLRISMRPE
jgi:uncharacterized protein with von Willebrand factor type A (vWA) domain